MPILEQISTTANRISQLEAGVGNNAQARVSDVNKVIDVVNDHEDRIDAIEGGTVDITDVQVEDGTVSVPSIHFADDLDTGIYRIGANNAGFAANGAKVLDIGISGLEVTGALGASTTVTAGTQLLVSGTTNQLRLGSVAGNDVIITSPAPAADRVLTIPDPGAAASFVMSEGASTINGVKTFGSGIVASGGVNANSQIAAFYPQVVQNDIAAGTGGAIAVTNYLTTINTDGTDDAFTLANGTQVGQMKKILLVADGGGNGVVTPATPFAGGTAATFDDAADFLILQWSGSAWVVLENSGVTIA